MTESPESLSPTGLERREAILRRTIRAARQRRRRRQALMLTSGLAVVAAAVVLVRHEWRPEAVPSLHERQIVAVQNGPLGSAQEPASVAAGPFVEIIPPDATVCARLSAPELPATWQSIDDDQLLAALAKTGQCAGLVRINGKAMLLVQR